MLPFTILLASANSLPASSLACIPNWEGRLFLRLRPMGACNSVPAHKSFSWRRGWGVTEGGFHLYFVPSTCAEVFLQSLLFKNLIHSGWDSMCHWLFWLDFHPPPLAPLFLLKAREGLLYSNINSSALKKINMFSIEYSFEKEQTL